MLKASSVRMKVVKPNRHLYLYMNELRYVYIRNVTELGTS